VKRGSASLQPIRVGGRDYQKVLTAHFQLSALSTGAISTGAISTDFFNRVE